MTRIAWLLIIGLTFYGCGSESEPDLDDDLAWEDEPEEAIETGALAINLPGDHGSGRAMCTIDITRASNKPLATATVMLGVIGKGCDGMGSCENPEMAGGDIMFNGGIDGDQPFATMVLNYEMPGDSGDEPMWMYNVVFEEAPFSRFEMSVDGEGFNLVSSDLNGADDYSQGPHLWDTKIDIEADMLRSNAEENHTSDGLEARGVFSFEGPCEIFYKSMRL